MHVYAIGSEYECLMGDLLFHLDDFEPEILILYCDILWARFLRDARLRDYRTSNNMKVILYFPVDGLLESGDLPESWIDILRVPDRLITMSRFGQRAVTRAGLASTCLPHGCRTDLFVPPISKDSLKERYGYKGKFVVLVDARNHRRKLLPKVIDIARNLLTLIDELVFHIHTNDEEIEEEVEFYDYSMRDDAIALGLSGLICFSSCLKSFPWDESELIELYQLADILLVTSYGEGFGLPTLQAASTGLVPIGPANSATQEMLGEHGIVISTDASAVDEYGLVRTFIDGKEASRTIEFLVSSPEELKRRSQLGLHFSKAYSWDNIMILWHQTLDAAYETAFTGTLSIQEHKKSRCKEYIRSTGPYFTILKPRLSIPANPRGVSGRKIMVSSPALLQELEPIQYIFKSVEFDCLVKNNNNIFYSSLDDVILVCDGNSVWGQLCAKMMIPYIGLSSVWDDIDEISNLLKVRFLLTNFALSEMRCKRAFYRIHGLA